MKIKYAWGDTADSWSDDSGYFASADNSNVFISSDSSGSPTVSGTIGNTTVQMTLYEIVPPATTAISALDLYQGQIGDCFLISPIGEIALTDSAFITNMIHINANGTETVTLYEASNGRLPNFGTTHFMAVQEVVTNVFPSYSVDNGASQDMLNGVKEIWPQVLEKAFAQLNGGYGAIANGGYPVLAMEELTGQAATYYAPSQISLTNLGKMITANDMIVLDTAATGTLPYGLVNDHAYMFESLVSSGGVTYVQALNPWGTNEPALIPFTALSKAFVEVDVGHAGPGGVLT
jgi:hypothetical protein